MATSGDYVDLRPGDGSAMRAFVAEPPGAANGAGVIVYQEAFGVNAHIRDVAGRFAAQGYLAIAPELYHRTGPGFEGRLRRFSFGDGAHEGAHRRKGWS